MKRFIFFLVLVLTGLSISQIFASNTVVLIYTGNINGSLRDCGCSGVDMGGLARVKTFVNQLRANYEKTYLIDTGDMFSSYYSPEKSLFQSSIIKELDYDFILKSDNSYSSGLNSFIEHEALHKNSELFDYLIDDDAYQYVPDSLKPKNPINQRINRSPFLVYHGGKEDYIRDHFDPTKKFVFLSQTQDNMEEYDETYDTYFFQPGMDTEFVGVIYLNERNGNYTLERFEQILMDSTHSEDAELKERIDAFFQHYEYDYSLPNVQNYFYFGAQHCQKCHTDVYDAWKETNHAHAYETLKQVNRAFDPDCISCHTTGFRQGGFKSLITTPQFTDVQCESCHIDLPVDHTRVSDRVGIPKVDVATCVTCHTEKNSPKFDLESYLLKIKHWKDE